MGRASARSASGVVALTRLRNVLEWLILKALRCASSFKTCAGVAAPLGASGYTCASYESAERVTVVRDLILCNVSPYERHVAVGSTTFPSFKAPSGFIGPPVAGFTG